MRSNIFDRVSFLSIFLVIVLLPLFFLPFTNIPVETAKGVLLVVGLAVCVISWCLARFFDGQISFPRSTTLVAGGGIVLSFLLSALFSKASQVSLFGTMFDIGSFWFMLSAFLLMVMSSIILRDHKKAKIVLFGAILSSGIVLLFQIIHMLAPAALTLGIFDPASKTDNLLGSWNSLGIFAGFSALMSLLAVEFLETTRVEKIVLQVLTVFSLILVAAVNFPFVWELLGIFALVIFVYKISITSRPKTEGEVIADASVPAVESADEAAGNRFPAFSFAIIMITLLFFISGDAIGGLLPSKLGIQNTEVSPSFGATLGVAKASLKENPVFGIGPNHFGEAWAKYKPANVNQSINGIDFWNVYFSSGSGLIPTLAITTGGLGILAWLIFFILFITSGVRSVFSSIKNKSNWETMAFFVLSLYFFVSSFFYSGGAVLLLLALAMAGVFIGLSAATNPRGEVSISYLSDHRKSFFSILFIVLIVIITAALTFKYMKSIVSVAYFGKAISAPTIPLAEASIANALRLHQSDLYFRAYAQIYMVKLNSIASKENPTEAEKVQLQTSLEQAVNGAQLATTYDSENYLNFQALGAVYQRLNALGVKDAYDKAIQAYTRASVLNPLNPGIKLNMANIAIAGDKIKEAKEYALAALALKADYIDALIILSQIAKSEGENALALSYAQKALAIAPANQDLIKYVDSLKGGTSSSSSTSTPAKKP